jgi:hypothetical protein
MRMSLRVYLDLLRKAAEMKIIARAVQPIQQELDNINTWIIKKGSTPPPEDFALDGEDQELDETLLGIGFVTCQAAMAHVASRAVKLADFCEANGINALSGWASKDAVYKLSEELVPRFHRSEGYADVVTEATPPHESSGG